MPRGRTCSGLFERKWTAQIVAALLERPQRFAARTGGITDKVLSRRPAELEGAGFVSRTLYPEIPPRVEYALTTAGLALEPVLAAVQRWSREYGPHAGAGVPR